VRAERPLVLANARLIDGLCEGVREGASVTVEDGRIVEVVDGGRGPATGGATVVDLDGAYLLPGLWDAHVHLEWPRLPAATVAELTVQYATNAWRGLTRSGITGIRTAGTPHFIDVALKRAYAAGTLDGPRIVAAGWFLTTTAGHALGTGFAKPCDGPTGFVRAVREQLENGVDIVKLNLPGGVMGPSWDRHRDSFLLPEELEAAFRICRQRGYPVMAHAASPDAVKAALRLGAHSVEHGYVMDDECLALFRETGAWYVPTLGITHLTPAQAASPWERRWVEQRALAPDLAQRADAAAAEHREWFQRALRAGVRMALGSDLRPLEEAVLLEMGLWVKNGATPWQALEAATRRAAECAGLGAEAGAVEAGKAADLVAVRDNPLDAVDHLRALVLVVKDGRIVADHRASPLGS
jgi:imidazolonepropionase-like amidohydrolase